MPRPPQPSTKSAFLTNVESVRGIAAFYVALSHTMAFTLLAHYGNSIFTLTDMRDGALKFIEGLINGQMAVTVFFVISGLVIGKSLDIRDTVAERQPYLLFLIRRVLRLYPAHIACTLA